MEENDNNKTFGEWTSPEGQDFVMAEADIDQYHNKGMDYLDAKQYEKAVEMFKKEIECDPNGSLGYRFLGKTLQAMGKKQEAKDNYETALKKAEEMNRQYPGSIDRRAIEKIKKDLASLGA